MVEFGIGRDAGFAGGTQAGHGGRDVSEGCETAGGDLVVGQRVVGGSFADIVVIGEGGQHDVGSHAAQLGRATFHAVVFLNGQFDRAGLADLRKEGHEALHFDERLHGSFAEALLVADDDRASVVLQGGGENLAGRGAEAVHENDERTFPHHAGIGIVHRVDVAVGVLDLHDGAFGNEEAGHADGLVERAAGVAPQVDDQAFDIFFLQSTEQGGDIFRRAAFGLAALVHAGVKTGQGDPADAGVASVGIDGIDDLRFGLLVLELDFVAHDGDDIDFGGVDRGGGKNLKTHSGAFLSADAFDDAVELHVDDILEFLVSLSDGDDAVVDLEFRAAGSGTARHEFDNLGVAVLAAQHRADADEGQAHLDIEIIQLALAHVFRVGIVALGKGREEGGGLVFAVFFLHGFVEALVALADGFDRSALGRIAGSDRGGGFGIFVLAGLRLFRGLVAAFCGRIFHRLLGEGELKKLGLEPGGPDFVGLGLVGRPWFLVAVDLCGAVSIEGEALVEECVDFFHAGLHALEEAVVNVVCGFEVAAEDVLVEPFSVLGGEFVDVLLGEEEAVVIEKFEVAVEGFPRLGHAGLDLLVEAGAVVVGTFQHAGHGLGDFAHACFVLRFFFGGNRWGGGRQESGEQQDG